MKNEQQIQAKIKDIEVSINETKPVNNQYTYDTVDKLLMVRNALQWVLIKDKYIKTDDFKRDTEYELLCFESTKIF